MALLVGIRADWKAELKTGLLYGLAFIALNFVLPQVTIGFPILKAQAFSDNFLAVVVLAPLVEELIFRFLLMNLLWAWSFNIIVIAGVSSALFSLFHYSAYGASLAAQNSSFIGAFLFGLVAAYFAYKKRSVVTPMIIHATFNAWLLVRYAFNV